MSLYLKFNFLAIMNNSLMFTTEPAYFRAHLATNTATTKTSKTKTPAPKKNSKKKNKNLL